MKALALLVIVALGDSTTAGTPFFRSPVEAPPDGDGDARAPFPYWMARERPSWKVLNRGVNGERVDQIAARFDRDVLPVKPKYVVILAGVNDVYQAVPEERTRRQLAALYERAAAAGIVPIAASVAPYDAAGAGERARLRALNAWIEAEAGRRGIPFCDLNRAASSPEDPDRLRGSPDGLHPDVDGYRRMGTALRDLVDRLESRRARPAKPAARVRKRPANP